MNRKEKAILTRLYEAPPAKRKDEFLMGFPERRISTVEFILIQFGTIKLGFWILNAAALLIGLWLSFKLDSATVWVLSSFAPFFSLLGICETLKSYIYNMSELEMTTRFSLKGTISAKLIIFGVMDFLIITVISLVFAFRGGLPLFRIGVYMLVPYLLTNILCCWLVRRIRSREALPYCFGCSVLVAASGNLLRDTYVLDRFGVWLLAFALLAAAMFVESLSLVKNLERTLWNYI